MSSALSALSSMADAVDIDWPAVAIAVAKIVIAVIGVFA